MTPMVTQGGGAGGLDVEGDVRAGPRRDALRRLDDGREARHGRLLVLQTRTTNLHIDVAEMVRHHSPTASFIVTSHPKPVAVGVILHGHRILVSVRELQISRDINIPCVVDGESAGLATEPIQTAITGAPELPAVRSVLDGREAWAAVVLAFTRDIDVAGPVHHDGIGLPHEVSWIGVARGPKQVAVGRKFHRGIPQTVIAFSRAAAGAGATAA